MLSPFKISENETENNILEYLTIQGVFCWKNPTAGYFDAKKGYFRKQVSQYAVKGVGDILGILPDGKSLSIEVKRPKTQVQPAGKVSQDQKLFIEIAKKNNGVAFVAYDCSDVKLSLQEAGYEIQ